MKFNQIVFALIVLGLLNFAVPESLAQQDVKAEMQNLVQTNTLPLASRKKIERLLRHWDKAKNGRVFGIPFVMKNCQDALATMQNANDTDGDGYFDKCEECPDDPSKLEAGMCGCGFADTDNDGDGTVDCLDECPEDPNTDEGPCG